MDLEFPIPRLGSQLLPAPQAHLEKDHVTHRSAKSPLDAPDPLKLPSFPQRVRCARVHPSRHLSPSRLRSSRRVASLQFSIELQSGFGDFHCTRPSQSRRDAEGDGLGFVTVTAQEAASAPLRNISVGRRHGQRPSDSGRDGPGVESFPLAAIGGRGRRQGKRGSLRFKWLTARRGHRRGTTVQGGTGTGVGR